MNTLIYSIPVIVLVFAGVVMALLLSKKEGIQRSDPITAKNPLSEHEQAMYMRLIESLPDHIILSQVAFASLITAKLFKTRNKFDRKYADFVVCKNSFQVLAVIELDDSSHIGRERADQARAALLTNAGYKVIRFKRIPTVEQVKKLFEIPVLSVDEKVQLENEKIQKRSHLHVI